MGVKRHSDSIIYTLKIIIDIDEFFIYNSNIKKYNIKHVMNCKLIRDGQKI